MRRRDFLLGGVAAGLSAAVSADAQAPKPGERVAAAARAQVGVTRGYDPQYIRLAYPNGDVPRPTGVCADVIVRAFRDALGLDLQQLVHEDMTRNFAAYPKTWGMKHADSNIDHRRVLNLEAFWKRQGAELWHTSTPTPGNGFPGKLLPGDVLTWRLDARLPHIGIVVADSLLSTRVVHNWGNGAEESALLVFAPHRAIGHYRWPRS